MPAVELVQMIEPPPAATTDDRRSRAQRALVELSDYIRAHIAELRRNPDQQDLISAMMAGGDDDAPLTDDELVSTCALLIFGGHETTTNFIANGVRALSRFPDQRDKLLRDRGLVDSAVEELLRYDGPSKMVMRRLEEDVTLRGISMYAGQNVYLVQGSANRDPDAFDDPDNVDIQRTNNRHVAFGFGIHHCLGNFLARMEGNVAITAFLRRYPQVRTASEQQPWLPTLISRGMQACPVVVGQPYFEI
ncbi:cytochrome P450 [Phytohabitans sp. ZYX-F-186]|uniref:Cytochrome P450 n=1 Tax=Phytohabitans maris TaxID=3071409 RepID=A0ABU0ZTJ1_9ACTN|nr:cytochrome P450 [Phytohabitans sp. ZYX-F-186]MDQ7909797.1 cytochrome P450 [Phytohabitans sp. ZYX-F-186]